MALRRLFIAAAVTTEARHGLASTLQGLDIPGRRVDPADWHLTLRFIGAIGEVEEDRLLNALDQQDLGDRFRVRWGGLGAFPRPVKATVVWLGLQDGVVESTGLAARVESAVQAMGAVGEDRPFRPHLTLSRVRPPRDVSDLMASFDPPGIVMPVDRVLLMASHLGRGGAKYSIVESFDLG